MKVEHLHSRAWNSSAGKIWQVSLFLNQYNLRNIYPQKYLLYTFKSFNFVAQIVPMFLPHALSLKFVLVLFINTSLPYCFMVIFYFILYFFAFPYLSCRLILHISSPCPRISYFTSDSCFLIVGNGIAN